MFKLLPPLFEDVVGYNELIRLSNLSANGVYEGFWNYVVWLGFCVCWVRWWGCCLDRLSTGH